MVAVATVERMSSEREATAAPMNAVPDVTCPAVKVRKAARIEVRLWTVLTASAAPRSSVSGCCR